MLPDFDENGNLPPGIHYATFDEIYERFTKPGWGTRLHRSRHLQAFYEFVSSFARAVYIDGSYITAKPDPKDIDVVVVLPEGFNTRSGDAARLDFFTRSGGGEGDLEIYHGSNNSRRIRSMIEFWQSDRDGNPKGIVCIEIQQ